MIEFIKSAITKLFAFAIIAAVIIGFIYAGIQISNMGEEDIKNSNETAEDILKPPSRKNQSW